MNEFATNGLRPMGGKIERTQSEHLDYRAFVLKERITLQQTTEPSYSSDDEHYTIIRLYLSRDRFIVDDFDVILLVS